ncbi:tautomerase family protein [Lentilactobacillus kribbianus]|uniref:tautomerase family protein n=1 Tax=Lentilactobacillus kribbianus TaxID=2729622 RepID=UPI001551A29E|nr:tautomerase family protein [Lentilactobacillus kribbianus]
MPVMRIDMIKGRPEAEIKQIMDIAYEVMLETFKVPDKDRYQVVTQHEAYEMNILDTGIGIERTDKVLLISLTSRARTRDQKELFYKRLVEELETQIGLRPADVVVNLTINGDDDWSFGNGEAHFVNGKL